MSALGDEALRLSGLGWQVFPCRPGRKDPRTEKGCKDATTNPAAIKRWWRDDRVRSNVGLATGPDSGLVVLDVDTAKGGMESLQQLIAKHGPLPHTVAVSTPSGGCHYYFTWPVSNDVKNRANFMVGLDIRGAGGYVVAPPSTLYKPDGEVIGDYVWLTDPVLTPVADLPHWLLDIIRAHHKKLNGAQHGGPVGPRPTGSATPYGEAALDANCEEIARSAPGTQEVTLRDRSLRIGSLVAGGEITESYAKAALIHAGMRMTNGEAFNPWTKDVVTEKVERHLAFGMLSPSKAPPREPPKLKTVATGEPKKTNGAGAAPKPQLTVTSSDWMKGLGFHRGDKGGLRPNDAHNLHQMLLHHPLLAKAFAYDEFADRVLVMRRLPGREDGVPPYEFVDADAQLLAAWLTTQGLSPSWRAVFGMVTALATTRWTFNPLKSELEGLVWDGVDHDDWLTVYAGAPDTPVTRFMARKSLISMVARAMQPGCQVDTMLILEGAQGIRKSSLLRRLADGERDLGYASRFGNYQGPDLASKDSSILLQGKWIIEFGEMDHLSAKNFGLLKEYVSRRVDRYRPPFGINAVDRPRRCAIVGSVNAMAGVGYLTDATGNRRYWPVACTQITLPTDAQRAQLLAWAMHLYQMDEYWWPDSVDEIALVTAEQDERYDEDVWTPQVQDWLRGRWGFFTARDVLMHCLEITSAKDHTQAAKTRVGKIMTRLKVKAVRERLNGVQVRGYRVGEPSEDQGPGGGVGSV